MYVEYVSLFADLLRCKFLTVYSVANILLGLKLFEIRMLTPLAIFFRNSPDTNATV